MDWSVFGAGLALGGCLGAAGTAVWMWAPAPEEPVLPRLTLLDPPLTLTVPPRPQGEPTPPDWRRREFDGEPFYIIPLEPRTGEGAASGLRLVPPEVLPEGRLETRVPEGEARPLERGRLDPR